MKRRQPQQPPPKPPVTVKRKAGPGPREMALRRLREEEASERRQEGAGAVRGT